MKKYLIILLLISTVLLSACSSNNNSISGQATNSDNPNSIQTVDVTMISGEYVFTPSVLKKDVPVKLVFDTKRIVGCARSFVMPAFNKQKYITESDNTLTFTPTQAGTFNVACTMNMYHGTFSVE